MSDAKITYDLMLLLDPALEPEQKNKILADTEATIAKAGEVTSKHDYGSRKTTFEIKKKGEAEYHLIQFHLNDRTILKSLDYTLRITDGVQRHRIIKPGPVGSPPDLKAASTESAPIPESTFDDDAGETITAPAA
jgi:small subunit ribosomal protein S6